MRSALVPVDGSDTSNAAVEVAIAFAEANKAKLAGMGIIDEPGITAREAVPMGATYFKHERDEIRLENASQRVQEALAHFSAACDRAGVNYRTVVARGTPYDEICRESHRHDGIVMGRESHFHFETQITPDEVFRLIVRDSPRPVIAVPKNIPVGSRVLVAYDGSLQSARSMQMHHVLGLCEGREVEVMTVCKDKDQAAFISQHAVDYYRERGVDVESYVVGTSENPAQAVLRRIEDTGPRILVMGSYGESGLKEFFFGSFTSTLIQSCPVPLFLFD